jgi:hypothetical protein
LLQDGSSAVLTAAAAVALNGYPLTNAKISEKRKIIEELALADVKKVRHGQNLFPMSVFCSRG